MVVLTEKIMFATKGHNDIIDLTGRISDVLNGLNIRDGIMNLCVVGSTAALTTCEYEPGLVRDLKDLFDKIIPKGHYNHDQAWGDGNGHAHLRASLLGPSLTIPFKNKNLILGTWQQIVFIDFDNRKRNREVTLQFIGE